MSGVKIDNSALKVYSLNQHREPVRVPAAFFIDMVTSDASKVGLDAIETAQTTFEVSTVFLGIEQEDGSFFETRIVGGEYNDSNWTYKTYDQALNGHEQITNAFREHYDSL